MRRTAWSVEVIPQVMVMMPGGVFSAVCRVNTVLEALNENPSRDGIWVLRRRCSSGELPSAGPCAESQLLSCNPTPSSTNSGMSCRSCGSLFVCPIRQSPSHRSSLRASIPSVPLPRRIAVYCVSCCPPVVLTAGPGEQSRKVSRSRP